MYKRKIVSLISNNKKIIENLSYLTVIQIISMLLPFITYPYLIKTLGLSLYGKVMLSQAIVSYVAIIIDFGFTISATKSIAEVISDKVKINEICSAIIVTKTIVWVISTIIYITSVLVFVNDFQSKILYLTAYTLTFNEFLICQWFFQAKEDMKIIALLSVIAKIINIALVFTFINGPSDYIYVSLLTGICYFITGVGCILLMLSRHIELQRPSLSSIKNVIKDSFNIFLTSAVITIKNKLDVILIGAFLNSEFVAIYDFSQKILTLALIPINIINSAVFAKMSREKSLNFLKKLIFASVILSTGYVLFAQLFIPLITKVLFVPSEESIFLTRMMMISVVVFSISLPLARNGLLIYGYTHLHLLGAFSTTIVYLLTMMLGYYFNLLTSLNFFLYTSIGIFSYELIYRIALCRWKKII
ncbi:oligosaccharide flippase family protein [Erwinia sp. MMLR14_017]|uniref:oligosaccharide flippase family protein n=1 Tax=Erwinia sp. MMLR14_017 TaxID=3093842 RepID=UPI0029905848|nr:oligosaccharide flippase family protein [Erwinia sp. MMLR14_017]MDW8847213.1 oligosaccharide flippase family protein [Erwinia sp. MMLR14_017]